MKYLKLIFLLSYTLLSFGQVTTTQSTQVNIIKPPQTASQEQITPIPASATTIAIAGATTQLALGQIGFAIKSLQNVPIQTASTENMTPIVSSPTQIGLAGTSTQDALGQIATILKTNEDIPQIFAKVGGVQTTNAISHTEDETAVRTGAIVIGKLTAPINAQVKADIVAGDINIDNTTTTTGAILKNGVLYAHNTGTGNVFEGINAGNRTTTSSNNIGMATESLNNLTSGNYNTALGYRALFNNTTGSSNFASGFNSMLNNTTGSSNFASGFNSMLNNTTGTYNIGIGYLNLFANTTGNGNTSLGFSAMTKNTTGVYNVGIGYTSLRENTTGTYNTAIGYGSLYSNTTGQFNSAYGFGTLRLNQTGSGNEAFGQDALVNQVVAINNVGVGSFSGSYIQENNNTAIGNRSYSGFNILSTTGVTALSTTQITLSAPMTPAPVVGSYVNINSVAGTSTITGFYYGVWKVISPTVLEVLNPTTVLGTIGTVTSVSVRSSLGFTNSSALGANSNPTASNQIRLGDNSVTSVTTAGTYFGAGFTVASDTRIKSKVKDVDVAIIVAIRDKSWQTPKMYYNELTMKNDIGIIAQNVPAILKPYLIIDAGSVIDRVKTTAKFKKAGYKDYTDYQKQKEESERLFLEEKAANESLQLPFDETKLKTFAKYKKDMSFDASDIFIKNLLTVDYTKLLFLQNSYQ